LPARLFSGFLGRGFEREPFFFKEDGGGLPPVCREMQKIFAAEDPAEFAKDIRLDFFTGGAMEPVRFPNNRLFFFHR
jgi:hypothetical protein